MKRIILQTAISTSLTLLGGCDTTRPEGPIGINNPRHGVSHYDTSALDGHGRGSVNGKKLFSVTLLLDGTPYILDDLHVRDDGVLGGTSNGIEFSGKDFIGSQWEAEVELEGARYEFTLAESGESICPAIAGGYAGAVVVGDLLLHPDGGVEDRPNTLLIGCANYGAAKAVLWGFGPQKVGKDGYQAAIRMVIADYCGTGDGHTEPGTSIQLVDIWGQYPLDNIPTMPTEAGWDEYGATCLSQPRNAELAANLPCARDLPPCEADPIADGALIWTWGGDASDL